MNATVLTELRGGRLDRGLDGADVAREAGLSAAQYSRIERGLTRSLSIEHASILVSWVWSCALPSTRPVSHCATWRTPP
jgi:hypothetical protein